MIVAVATLTRTSLPQVVEATRSRLASVSQGMQKTEAAHGHHPNHHNQHHKKAKKKHK